MTANKERILLIGGTSDAVNVAQDLLSQGHWVLHSRFTNSVPMQMPHSSHLVERFGALDFHGFANLIIQERIHRIVDAAHPFATQLHQTIRKVSDTLGIPYVRIDRPLVELSDFSHIHYAADHLEAVEICVAYGGTIFATIGSRNIDIYQRRIAATGQSLYARVLDDQHSLQACLACGIAPDHIIQGRGPFSIEQNLEHLSISQAKILVTKESGIRGGLPEKLRAAELAGCIVVLIKRPQSIRTD